MRKLIVMALAIVGATFAQDISYRTLSGTDPRGTIRISAGSTTQYVDTAGNLWNSDSLGYGATGSVTGYGAVCTPPFAGTSDSTLYQTARWAQNGTSMSFTFNLFPGTYDVTFRIMETQVTTANTRTFRTFIDGVDLGIVDTYALAGARCKATSKSYTVTAGPTLTVTLTAVLSIAMVQAIEITPSGAPPSTTDFTGLAGYGLYVDNMPVTGTASVFDDSLLRSTSAAVTLPGIANNCYLFRDGDIGSGSVATGATAVDGCIVDVGGTATSSTLFDSGAATISHVLALPTLNGAGYAGPLSSGTFTGSHNTCYSSCGSGVDMTTSLTWSLGQSNDPAWFDPQRNLALFDSKYLGNSYATWSSGATYTAGDFVSLSLQGWAWGNPINFRYTNGTGCSSANPKPLVTAGWRNCWEYASLYHIRMALPDISATPPRNTLAVIDDQSIGAHGDTYIAALWKWVRAGYAPTNAYYVGRASDGYDSGAMSVIFAKDPVSTLTAALAVTFGGKMQIGGKVKVQE